MRLRIGRGSPSTPVGDAPSEWLLRVFWGLLAGLAVSFLTSRWAWDHADDITRGAAWRWVAAGLTALAVLLLPWFLRLSSGVKAIAAALTAILGAVFLVLPNLAPPTIDSYEFKNYAIEQGVTLGAYEQHYPVKSLLHEGAWSLPSVRDPGFGDRGTVVLFDTDVKGRANDEIALRWSLFNAKTKERLANSFEIDPLCTHKRDRKAGDECVVRTPHRKDSDVAGFELWVNTAPWYPNVKCFYIRLQAISHGGRLTSSDSPVFASESASANACEAVHQPAAT